MILMEENILIGQSYEEITMNKDRDILKMSYPSAWWHGRWREALPLGNGEMGAAVYGDISEETVMLTHADLWWKSRTSIMPDVSDRLTAVREAMFADNAKVGDRILTQALIDEGYDPKMGAPLPLGDLKVVMPCDYAFRNYQRTLDMQLGEVKVTWMDGPKSLVRSSFVSRTDNLFVMSVKDLCGGPVKAAFSLERHDVTDAINMIQTVNKERNLDDYLPENCESKAYDGFICYSARNDDGTDFGAVAKVLASECKVTEKDIEACDDNEVLVLVKLFIKGQRNEAFNRLKKELDQVTLSYDELLGRHAAEHQSLMNSAQFTLYSKDYDKSNEALIMSAYTEETPQALIEKLWSFGRYLLIASSKEEGHPCQLYGLWCGEYEGMWAFNMLNENVQMIYWHALSGNMPDLMFALFDYYERLMDDFRENAEKLYGCRGIYIPAPTAPDSGLLKHVTPHIIHWTGGAGWLAQHYYDFFAFTGDLDFLRNRAMPFMKEAAMFYEDFFIEGADGYFVSCPSNSPENTPGNYWKGDGMGAEMETTINATMDFAIAKELFTNLIKGGMILGYDEDQIGQWEKFIAKIPPYQINEDGAVTEWMHEFYEDNYHHRHESHLYPVFPGTEVTKENNPELFDGFIKAVEKRLVIGLGEQSGWSLAHMANNYARMGQGNQALDCIEIMARSCLLNNFYTLHNDWRKMGIGVKMEWAPIQLDANMGLCSAVNEMLLFSVDGQIKLMPALPEKWRKGTVKGLRARGAVEVAMDWDFEQKRLHVTLDSLNQDLTICLVVPHFVTDVEGCSIKGQVIENIELKRGFELELDMSIK